MLIEQIPLNNTLRNYMYLVACPKTKEAVAIDPLYDALCLSVAKEKGWRINAILNTHEHHDHIGGNAAMVAATGAKLYAHHKAVGVIPDVDVPLSAGDIVQVGDSVQLTTLDTPGHTFCHSCFYFAGNETMPPAIFSGDTLFNAGVGNCHNGGDPEVMYETFAQQIFTLSDDTQIYPGHDYIENNIRFTLSREPENRYAQGLLAALTQCKCHQHFISNIGIEREINAFFRLQNKAIIAGLITGAEVENIEAKQVFLQLREYRNQW